MKKPKGVLIYLDDLEALQELSMEERGLLFTAVLEYAKGQTIDSELLQGGVRYLWPMFRTRIDGQIEKYQETCERNRKNRNKSSVEEEALEFYGPM